MGYFDGSYFDCTYFDCGTTPSTGGGTRGRRRPVLIPDDPEQDDALIVALTL